MRYLLIIWMMAFLCGCAGKSTDNEVLQIDLNAEHSSIRLNLKDIADVTYIKLASNTDLLVRSRALVCNENYILTKGGETGEILMFDREGQPVRKFSHYGNGPHEYNYITNLRMDEKRGEIYVHDVFSRKIVVYDLNGEYIREFASGDARFIYNFNDDAFLVYNTETNRVNSDLKPYFSILAKNDGEIQKKIEVPFSSGKKYDLTVTKEGDDGRFSYTAMHLPVVRNSEGYILNELSSDTIYQYSYVS
ncbi:6-bladed beta-propeller [Parabacteroides sp. AF48-14]|nr:6-bladed beta-propeller [Parabacteroides sp. AF48-14]